MIKKHVKVSKKIILSLITATMISCAFGCNTDFTKDTPFDTGTPTQTVTEVTGTENTTPTAKAEQPTPDVSNPTPEPTGNSTPGDDTATPTQSVEGTDPTSAEAITDEPVITTTATPTPSIRDAFDRDEYWDKTFLVWLPKFKAGSFSGQNSAGTYDYATFTNVTANDVNDYISSLKAAGFTNINKENHSDSEISFGASNDKSWEVKLSFAGDTLVLGSGFNDGAEGNDEKINSLYSTTMLQYMPKFTKGSYVSSETHSDATMYSSIVYTGVTKDEALSYINEVKNKGYIYVEDEDVQDDALWYIALNEERFECHVEFSGSELKIGCGYMDED